MNFDELENLKDSQLFDLQNKISDIVRQRNLEKGDLEEIIDNSFNVGFPKVDGLGLNPWIENSLIICPGARIDKTKTRHICKFIVVEGRRARAIGIPRNDVLPIRPASCNV